MEIYITTDNFELFSELLKKKKKTPKYMQGCDRGEFKFVRVEKNTPIFLNSTSEQLFFFWIFF